MTSRIERSRNDRSIETLWIDHLAHRNALNDELVDALAAGINAAGANPACRALVIRGRSGIVCAAMLSAVDRSSIGLTAPETRRRIAAFLSRKR